MNFFDIAILAVLAGFLLKGVLRGLLKELCSLLGLVVGTLLALHFYVPLAETMAATFRLPKALCAVITFTLLFLAAVLVFWGLGFLLTRVAKLTLLGGMNRVAGGFFGLAEAVLLLAVILYVLSSGGLPKAMQPAFKRAQLVPPFCSLGDAVFHRGNQLLEVWK
jgi:membrane protein required for colicin V production